MIPSSDSVTPLFIERLPDWSQGVDLDAGHRTKIFASRTGLEQRQRGRATPIYRIAYQQAGLTRAEFLQRQQRVPAEIISPLVVPFWTERANLQDTMTGDSANIDVLPRPEFFAAGQYIYLIDATNGGQFRKIASVTGTTLTLDAQVGSHLYASGTACYPCRVCRRIQGEDKFTRSHLRCFAETLIFETIL